MCDIIDRRLAYFNHFLTVQAFGKISSSAANSGACPRGRPVVFLPSLCFRVLFSFVLFPDLAYYVQIGGFSHLSDTF
jgi:hypothetical protein